MKKVRTTGNTRYEDTLPGVTHQRGAARRSFHARVRCWIQYGDESTYWQSPFWGVTEDICHEGIFVSSGREPAIDSLVILQIYTDHGVLKLMARVVHNIEGTGFGCRFIHLSEQQQVALMFLKTMKGRAPAPGQEARELAA